MGYGCEGRVLRESEGRGIEGKICSVRDEYGGSLWGEVCSGMLS